MPAAKPSQFFGINGQKMRSLVRDTSPVRLEQLERQLAYLPGGRIGFVRADVDWRGLQPEAPTGDPASDYEFSELDMWVAALAEHRIRWQPVLALFVPEWAADPDVVGDCGSRSAPAEEALDDYAAAFAAVAERYGRGGSFWAEHDDLPSRPILDYEVWNEPNGAGFWCPTPDPARYARLYAKARAAIEAVDVRARVLFGGLAGFREDEGPTDAPTRQSFTDFLAEAVDALPGDASIDVLGVHAYGTPTEIFGQLADFRATLGRLGFEHVPIAFNEFGWTRDGPGRVPEDERARLIGEVTVGVAAGDCGVIRLAPHTWITLEQDRSDPEDFFGLANYATGRPYQAGQAYLELTRELREQAPPEARIPGICTPAPDGR